MNNNLSVIILAAGMGTRMKSAISKPLHKVGNLEMINHVINMAEKLDSNDIIVVASRENEDHIKKSVKDNIKIVIQEDRNGTGGAVKVAVPYLNKNNNKVLIMYGDVPLITYDTYNNMINNENDLVVLGFHTKDISNKYGRLVLNNNKLEKIIEFKDASEEERKNTLCNAGILLIKQDLLKLLDKINNNNASKEYYLTDIIELAKKDNKDISFSIADEDEVMGVNSRDQLAIAENIFQNRKRQEFMKNGVTLIDPESVYFSYDTEIENDVVIEPNVVFLTGVKINSNVEIKSFSYLEKCEIKSGAIIGPFARIRPDTIIENNAKIGNFCEIKKSIIGEGTKVNHLTYIGDTTIGKNTNIGAGTITCNYDGYKKSKTVIGDNCFIGSNTIMVAPVELGNDSLTGAGSVITKNVNSKAIAITRAEQRNIENAVDRYRSKRQKNN